MKNIYTLYVIRLTTIALLKILNLSNFPTRNTYVLIHFNYIGLYNRVVRFNLQRVYLDSHSRQCVRVIEKFVT